MIRKLRSALLLTCLAAPMLHAAVPAAVPAADDYSTGTVALDQQRWQDAVTSFDRVVAAKTKKADAALYWKAYALNKLGRGSLVSATCEQLRSEYKASTWNKDCGALVAAGAATGAGQSADYASSYRHAGNPDDELKALALNSLLNREPAQALPLVRNILTGDSSPELKRRTLDVLAMNKSGETQAILRDVATGKLAPAEQRHAIQMLGVFQGRSAGDLLTEIYRTTGDRGIKRAVTSALFVSGNAPLMVELARNEKDLSLKHDLVAQLALMQDKAATDYMLELLK